MSSPVQESGLCDTSPAEPETSHNNETGDTASETSDSSVKHRPAFALRMLNFCKEVTVMVLIAVTYAALTNESPPKVSKSPAAYPFFPKDSLVTDWYKGQITEAIEQARSSDIAFVMFYAPWDAESQTARSHIELAAKFMHKHVAFVSINCWQPGSECKRQYSKVYKWPVLIAYPTHGRGIQYNGPLEAFHMIKFLQNICKPIVRPFKVDELIGKYDTIVAANINVLPGSYEYAVFYSTALRFLERDPFRNIIFAVLPQKKDNPPNIQLHLWNRTIKYGGEWNTDSLSTWILKNLQQVIGWITPTGMKSLTLAGFVQPGPTLILFTPKNPLLQEIDYYNMLREVAYEYYNCANDTEIEKRQKLVSLERLRNRENYQKLKRKCLSQIIKSKDIITTVPNVWTNNTWEDFCNCRSIEGIKSACHANVNSAVNLDHMSPEYLQKYVIEEECHQFLITEKYSPPIFEKRSQKSNFNITGLACKTNVTLSFIALDSLRYYHFANKLGINLRDSGKSGVVIINEKMETHHVMEGPLSSTNVRLFIYNFTQKTLSRSLRSQTRAKTKNNHTDPHLNCSKENQFCVAELTSTDFIDTIMQPNKVVVVFYYSKQCSFCNGISYIFLTAAKMLSGVEDIIFTRIDGDTNLLPWEYTMETYPTILLVPANRKSESRAFPRNVPITVPNLIGFLLTNVQPVLKLKTMWSICCQTKYIDEKMRCIASVRTKTLSIIEQALKEWRTSTRKHKVLYKLQVLRQLHLLLVHSPDKTGSIRIYLNKLRD